MGQSSYHAVKAKPYVNMPYHLKVCPIAALVLDLRSSSSNPCLILRKIYKATNQYKVKQIQSTTVDPWERRNYNQETMNKTMVNTLILNSEGPQNVALRGTHIWYYQCAMCLSPC